MNKNKFLNTAKVLVIALALSVGIQYVVAQTWTAPTATPPAGNAFSPLNVGGGTGQTKVSGLTIGTGVADPSPALIVPTGRVSIGAGLAPGARLDVKGDIRADLTNKSGAAGRDAIKILASADNNIGSILVNKPQLELWNSTGGVRAHLWVNGLDANGSVRIAGGAPAAGKVLTATNDQGNATWQTPAGSGIGRATGVVNDGVDLDQGGRLPAGFAANECSFMVSLNTAGIDEDLALDVTTASVGAGNVVNCEYSQDDENGMTPTTCNYMIICSR